MKILLACLMCLILSAAECFALKGGPPYPASANFVGTYAGVLQPTDTTDSCGANSLGVFSIGVPTTGVSAGAFVMFAQGRVFTGTIRGIADPGKATLKAVLNATLDFTVVTIDPVTGRPTTIDVTASANGRLDSKISTPSRSFGAASTRIKGDAKLGISQAALNPDLTPKITCPVDLSVIGFKQSNTATITP